MADRKTEKRILPDAAGMGCEQWIICLAEAIDGRLPDQVAPLFERHRASCEACGRMMEEARQGLAWLDLVKEEPEPPSDLLQAILARTGPQAASPPQPAGSPALLSPAAPQRLAWRGTPVRQWFESRATSRGMMTVAMGIFSLAVTLRAASVRPAVVYLAEAQPGELGAILSRPYFAAHERIAKYCENLKVVREMEVGVRDFTESDGTNDASPSENRPAVIPRGTGGDVDGVNGIERLRESLERDNLAMHRNPGVTPPGGNREGDSGAEKRGA